MTAMYPLLTKKASTILLHTLHIKTKYNNCFTSIWHSCLENERHKCLKLSNS